MTKQKDTTIEETGRGRVPRKKTYERVRETALPEELHEHFKTQGYDLKLVRWAINGDEDYRYLNRREREGYEFVQESDIPAELLKGYRTIDTKSRAGLIIMGDLCLMKVDSDLRADRRRVYQSVTDREVSSVDVHVLEKKGFRNLGTKSKVLLNEPKFQND